MRIVRCLLAIALVFGITGVSRADTLDFHMVVLDPFATTPIFTTPFSFSFDPCVVGQLPTNVNNTYVGCFSGVNRTGQDWVGLQLVFSNTAPLGSQPAGCALDGSTDYFQNATCALAPGGLQYILSFTGGAIPNNGGFVIAEDGVDPALFPMISATVTVATVTTPEPNSVWLLSAGVLMAGVHFGSQRRWAFRTPRL